MQEQAPTIERGRYVVSDIVAAILAESGVDAFTGNSIEIQETFFKLSQDSALLKKAMPFSMREATPFSRELEDSLIKLELSRIIGMENPDYDRYIVKSFGKQFITTYIMPLFNDAERQEIKDLALIFVQKCGTQPQQR